MKQKSSFTSLRGRLRKSLPLLLAILFFSSGYAQEGGNRFITGTVSNRQGELLAGVSISITGTTVGTMTDAQGKFSLSVPDSAITLEISYIGYETQFLKPGSRQTLDIILEEASEGLDQVIVVGYTTQKKKDLTGALSVIDAKNINGIPVGGVDQIMQGKAAGVTITQNTGAPGAGVSVRIRGVGTINNNDPLYIVDGIPTKDGINEISPNDIESITVLKDASSASIYGARASNGVILITTKKGKTGAPRVNLNFYTGVETPANLIKMANTPQYIKAYNTAAANDGRPQIPLDGIDTLADVNWQKEVLKNAPQTNAQLSLSGGTENTKYILSATYFTQKGLIENSSNDRFNLRTSIDSRLNKLFRAGTNINLAYNKTREVASSGDGFASGLGGSIMRYALFATPASPVRFKSGPYAGEFVDRPATLDLDGTTTNVFGDGLNPVGLAAHANRNFKNYSLLGNVYLELTPVDHLKIRTDFGTNFIITDFKDFKSTWGIDRPGGHVENSPNALSQYNQNVYNYNWTNTATYDWIMDRHTLNILVGTEIIYNSTKLISASTTDFPNQTSQFQYLSNGNSTTPAIGGDASSSSLSSVFGRLDYQYDQRYLASFTARRDGSSRLDPDNRWGSFYAGSVGWRIDREAFMQDVRPVSLMKLRASLGQLGNQEIPIYGYASLIGSIGYYPFNGMAAPAYTVFQKGNPNVKWETSTIADIGLDLGFFNGALSISADYYRKITTDLLVKRPNPSSAGTLAEAAFENNGKVLNRGFEFEASYQKQINHDWHFEVGGNLTTIHNEVLELLNDQPIPSGQLGNGGIFIASTAVGHPIGSFYLLRQEGVFQNDMEVFTHAYQGLNIRPGDIMFKDVVEDGVIDEKDRVFAGSSIPRITYGFTGSVIWKNLDLSLFFQGVSGNKIYNQANRDIEGFYRSFNLTKRALDNAWNGEGSTNEFARLSFSGGQNNTQASTRFLEDGSYLRLKNLQIGYTFGDDAINRLKIASMRIFVSAQNLFTITKYTGLDPEMGTSADAAAQGDGVRGAGIDWGTYPSSRIYTAGININF